MWCGGVLWRGYGDWRTLPCSFSTSWDHIIPHTVLINHILQHFRRIYTIMKYKPPNIKFSHMLQCSNNVFLAKKHAHQRQVFTFIRSIASYKLFFDLSSSWTSWQQIYLWINKVLEVSLIKLLSLVAY